MQAVCWRASPDAELFFPYCVASYSAAKNEIIRREDED